MNIGMPGLTILIPVLNEVETLEGCVREAQECLEKLNIDYEILIADNGSTDGSQSLARELGARVVDVPVKGYGSALRAGISAAKYEYIIMGDADGSYDFATTPEFLKKLDAGYDLVVGNRFKGGIEAGAMPPLHRFLGNPVLSLLGRIAFTNAVGDFHCGLRAFKKSKILELKLRSTGMEFATEMIAMAGKLKLNICEVPTPLRPDRRNRAPHLRTWRDGWRHLKFIAMYSPSWIFFIPAIVCLVIGGLGVVLTECLNFHFRDVGFSVGTELVCVIVFSAGYQIMLMGLLAKLFAAQTGIFPISKKIQQISKILTPDRTMLGGFLCFLLGLGAIFIEFIEWGKSHFASLQTISEIKLIGLSILLVSVGAQSIFFGVFQGLLGVYTEIKETDLPD